MQFRKERELLRLTIVNWTEKKEKFRESFSPIVFSFGLSNDCWNEHQENRELWKFERKVVTNRHIHHALCLYYHEILLFNQLINSTQYFFRLLASYCVVDITRLFSKLLFSFHELNLTLSRLFIAVRIGIKI